MSEPDVSDLITGQQAIEILDAAPVQTRTRKVKLLEAAGLYLAQDVVADRDYPAFEKSLMDGFAVRTADSALTELKWLGEVRAGQQSDRPIESGQAMAIMTGAPLPAGADAVVPVEFAQRTGDSIRITKSSDFTRFVAHRGSDCTAGTTLLSRGTRLEAPQLAVAATVGADEVEAYDPPRVAILSTGDELVPIGQRELEPQQIRNSNGIMLAALLRQLGCVVNDIGTVRDEMPELLERIKMGSTFDALFISGGMSVGAYDLPPKALVELGANLQITKLKIKPGKPFVYAKLNECHVFGLPGNPLAGFVCTIRLASRLLRRMSGGSASNDFMHATLAQPLPANGPREFYQPAIVENGVAQPLNWKGSADVFTLARANALLIRAENEPAQPAGALCKLIAIPS